MPDQSHQIRTESKSIYSPFFLFSVRSDKSDYNVPTMYEHGIPMAYNLVVIRRDSYRVVHNERFSDDEFEDMKPQFSNLVRTTSNNIHITNDELDEMWDRVYHRGAVIWLGSHCIQFNYH